MYSTTGFEDRQAVQSMAEFVGEIGVLGRDIVPREVLLGHVQSAPARTTSQPASSS